MEYCDYRRGLQEAYVGELIGKFTAEALLRKFGSDYRYTGMIRALGLLEARTAGALEGVLRRHGIAFPDADAVAAQCRAEARACEDWEAMMALLRDLVPPLLTKFEDLVAFADEDDRPVLIHLVAHERLVLEAAHPSSDQKLASLIDEINRCAQYAAEFKVPAESVKRGDCE